MARARTIDWDAIGSYVRAVRAASRSPRESRADDSMSSVDVARVRAFRARASHLDQRLPPGSFAEAARGGLQDSAPRDALLALHARVENVTSDAWEHETLSQIWFRWADYMIPRDDAGIFTLGALPRDETQARALCELAEAIADVLDGEACSPAAIESAIPGMPGSFFIRAANVAGRFTIRWDARTVSVLPAPSFSIDPEEARHELARRFLRWLGPATAQRFARWAGVTRSDAEQTWSALSGELAPVAVEGYARSILATGLSALVCAKPIRGARFIPQGDPFLAPDKLVGQIAPKIERPGVDRRVLNSLAAGRVVVDGELVASWGRRQQNLTIAPWHVLTHAVREAIAKEGASLEGPIGKPMKIRWLD